MQDERTIRTVKTVFQGEGGLNLERTQWEAYESQDDACLHRMPCQKEDFALILQADRHSVVYVSQGTFGC